MLGSPLCFRSLSFSLSILSFSLSLLSWEPEPGEFLRRSLEPDRDRLLSLDPDRLYRESRDLLERDVDLDLLLLGDREPDLERDLLV